MSVSQRSQSQLAKESSQHVELSPSMTMENTGQVDVLAKSLFSTAADYHQKREQLEAKEARRHKREFIGFF